MVAVVSKGRTTTECPVCKKDAPVYAIGGSGERADRYRGLYFDEHADGAGLVCQSAGEKLRRLPRKEV